MEGKFMVKVLDVAKYVLEKCGEVDPYYLRELVHYENTCEETRGNLPVDVNSDKELSADNSLIIFTFYNIDRDGEFAFNPARKDFDSKLFIEKLISYLSMTWQEFIQQTHDDGKYKNHFLSPKSLSKKALEHIEERRLTYIDSLFSLALTNKTRFKAEYLR